MPNHKLTSEEIKQLADYIAKAKISSDLPAHVDAAVNNYLTCYNRVIDKLEDYNRSVKE